MHHQLLPCFSNSDSSLLRRAETLWQQARVMIWEITQRVQTRRELLAEQRVGTLRQIGQALITTFDMEDLMEVLAEKLPHLEIPGCYLAIYENPQPYKYPQSAPEWSQLLLAYNDQKRIGLPLGGQRFLSNHLLPEGVLPQHRCSHLVVMPLYFREHQIGFVLFEIGPHDGNIYHVLRTELSSALQGALLVQRVQENAHELAAANEEIHILNEQLKEENVRMSAELNVARKLQEMILPSPEELQQIEGLEIVGFMQPADEVGGDYYDVLKENGLIHIGIGDVTGHGLESGVLMLMTQTVIRTLIEHGETDSIAFINTLNRTICKNARRMGADKSLTFALIDYQDGQLKIVGQHEEILVVRQGGQIEQMDTFDLGFPIGLEHDIAQWVASTTISLQPGDGIVLYTDGITEAENPENELYGLDRLREVISQYWNNPAETIKQAVVDDVFRHIGQQKIYDDLTLVVLKQQ
jgi:serine phosphatase RsbU (regulator of sigma subunit)